MSQTGSTPGAAAGGEGRVELRARWRDGRIAELTVGSRRPPATRLLAGRPAGEIATLVPRLFSLCGRAQADAAASALAAARGRSPSVGGAARQREIIGEHLWRFMLDWPALLDLTPDPRGFAAFYRALRGATPASGLQGDLLDWYDAQPVATSLAVLEQWDARCAPANCVLMCERGEMIFPNAFQTAGEGFSQAPTCHGEAAEVGALTDWGADPRVAGLLSGERPLAARYLARWLALGEAIAALTAPETASGARQLGAGVGCAWVATARGPLAHRVELRDEIVVDYRIVAPTEWNFHGESAWLRHLAGARAETPEHARALLRRWVLALDPCVPAQITIEEI